MPSPLGPGEYDAAEACIREHIRRDGRRDVYGYALRALVALRKGGWKLMADGTTSRTERMSVPGGWVYRTRVRTPVAAGEVWGEVVAMCFVPAPYVGSWPKPKPGTG